ncbi:Protein transport protein S9 plasma membrane t-SNARE [Thoreauomyces humboldtii]|nr:Protein transport protein S9 plasma membrane t-SNARE [Thoreauomyces humboldtii]
MSRYSNQNDGYSNSGRYGDRVPQPAPRSYNGNHHGVEQPPAGNRWAAAAQAAEQEGGGTSYRSWETVDEEPEKYDDSDWLDRKTTKVQNDSLLSSRRALQRMHEADAVAVNNLNRLHSQGEQLNKVSSRLESAQSHAKVSDAKADHLKSLNKYFFLPSFGGKKAKRREDRVLAETTNQAPPEPETEAAPYRSAYADSQYGRGQSGGHYSTPANIKRDATEEEIDSNIDQISSGLSRLKMMSSAMNASLDAHNAQIRTISGRADTTSEYMRNTTRKVNDIR